MRQIKMMTVASIEASVQIDPKDADRVLWAADQLRGDLKRIGINAGVKFTVEDEVDFQAESEATKETPDANS